MEIKDIFICHAKRDKKYYISPFLKALEGTDITYWIDEGEIRWGDSLFSKICEGISKSRYILVFLTKSFLKANWAQSELANAFSLERQRGKVFILPLLVAPHRDIFSKYPLLIDKMYLKWSDGFDSIISNIIMRIEEDKKIYLKCINEIDDINIGENLKITEIRYGEGANIDRIGEDDLFILGKDTRINTVKNRGSFFIKNLFHEDTLKTFVSNEKLHFPRHITVSGMKTRPDRTVALFSIKDIVYPPEVDSTGMETFEIKRMNGRGGIAEFVDGYGNFHMPNFRIGKDLGGIGVLVAIEFEGELPVYRSRYVVIVRKGIRYPDDIWLSTKTNKPITQPGYTDLSEAKFVFQSRELYSTSSDIFVSNFSGTIMHNLTEDDQAAADQFVDNYGNEVIEWVDEKHIRYYSATPNGVKRIITKVIPCIETHS